MAATATANLRVTYTPGEGATTPDKVRLRSSRSKGENTITSTWMESGIGKNPRSLSASYTNGQPSVSWKNPDTASYGSYSYHVESSSVSGDGATWTRKHTVAATSSMDLSRSVIAKVRVRAINSSDVAGMWVEATLPGPANVGAQIQSTTLKLRREKLAGVTGSLPYVVECNNSESGGTWSSCATVTATGNAVVTASVNNKGSVKRVRVKVGTSTVSGPWTTAAVPSGVPAAPGSLSVTFSSGTTVAWKKPSGLAATDSVSYEVTCSNDGGSTWTYCGATPHTVAATTNTDVSTTISGKTATNKARVAAIRDGLRSAAATWTKPLDAQTNVGAQLQGTTLKARWDKPSGVKVSLSYAMQCNNSESGEDGWRSCKTVSATANSVITASVANKGSVKRVRVRAERDGLQGAWTAGAVPSGVPGVPSFVYGSVNENGDTVIYVDPPNNDINTAHFYRVQCTTDYGSTRTACNVTFSYTPGQYDATYTVSSVAANGVRGRTERDGLHSARKKRVDSGGG